jgi:copper chaperone CopZ
MEKVALCIPALWADHHVTNVKRLLSPISGVEDVLASSAFKEVMIEFDPSKTSRATLEKALTDAGYAPGEEQFVAVSPYATADPSWETQAQRITTTNMVDLQLSGEFRKY